MKGIRYPGPLIGWVFLALGMLATPMARGQVTGTGITGADISQEPRPETAVKPDGSTDAASPDKQDNEIIKFHGSYWLHWNQTSAFDLDENGFRDGLNMYLDHRLRVEPEFKIIDDLSIVISVDLAGQLAGDTTQTGKDVLIRPRTENKFYERSTVRKLYLDWKTPIGVLRVGQMTSEWGLGLVANGGDDEEGAFHDPLQSDIVDRVIFATRPVPGFYIAVGGDVVFSDDNADILDGDLAFEGILSLFYKDTVVKDLYDLFAGVYAAYRNQTYDNDDKLWAVAIDAYMKHDVIIDEHGSKLSLAAEGVYILGRLDFNSRSGPPRARDGADLRQYGMVLRAEVDAPKWGLLPSLEFGLASGDKDSLDDVARGLKFDPNYQVGMILFQEVLGRMSAHAPDRVSDPSLVYQPPEGYKLAATNGSITNALYLYPRFRYRPAKGLEIQAAFLWAQAMEAVSSPYNAAGHGGYPLGYRVDPVKWGNRKWNGKALGIEVDAAISYRFPVHDLIDMRLGIQGAWARPGAAFDDTDGNSLGNLYKLRATADIIW
ncbi:MAG: hypothetical protein GXP54_05975 [Deltaproteobacteria bacterium]|nr:hypothetical protein [Deltaproteobacteria bacterium]